MTATNVKTFSLTVSVVNLSTLVDIIYHII